MYLYSKPNTAQVNCCLGTFGKLYEKTTGGIGRYLVLITTRPEAFGCMVQALKNVVIEIVNCGSGAHA
jgi:hypothetical protein